MKSIVLKLAVWVIVTVITAPAHAQTERKLNTAESFRTQLKNGTVPGWKFAPETPMLQSREEKLVAPQYSVRDILNGKAPAAPAATTQRVQQAVVKPLPAVQMASSAPVKKVVATVPEKPVVPSQEPPQDK